MKYGKLIAFLSLIFLLSSCYHAKISTEKQPSNQVIDQPWAHGFVFGLVGPSEVNASETCDNGVAMVETKMSFLNQVASALTFNLYTPMHITVTCAAGGMSSVDIEKEENMNVAENSSDEEVANTIKKAANKSSELQRPVYIKFE